MFIVMNHINQYVFYENVADCKLERAHNWMNKTIIFYSTIFYSIHCSITIDSIKQRAMMLDKVRRLAGSKC